MSFRILDSCRKKEGEAMKIDRGSIEKVLRRLNEAENRRPKVSVAETIAGIDAVMAPDVEGWHNGVHVPNREAERQGERVIFEMMADYHREFERVIIDPPFAAFTWKVRGTMGGKAVELPGCSVMEINAEGKIRRYWLYADMSAGEWSKTT
jgi:ketosteroid isomerase-like protein